MKNKPNNFISIGEKPISQLKEAHELILVSLFDGKCSDRAAALFEAERLIAHVLLNIELARVFADNKQ